MSTVTLKIREDAGYDSSILSDLLQKIDPSASINGDSITVEATLEQSVRAILAEVGIEVLDNAVTASVTLTQPSTQPELLEAAATKISMNGFSLHLTATDDNAVWNIIDATATPIAAIHLNDQENKDSLAAIFATADYGNQVKAAFESLPVKDVLERVKARLYSAVQVKAPEKVDIQAHVSENALRASHCTDLALLAMQKNVIEDPLKQNMLAALAAHEVPNAAEVVAGVFESFPAFMQMIRAQTEKYMGMDASGLQATEEMLQSMDAREIKPAGTSPATGLPLTAAAIAMRTQLATGKAGLPTVTASVLAKPAVEQDAPNDLRAMAAGAFTRNY